MSPLPQNGDKINLIKCLAVSNSPAIANNTIIIKDISLPFVWPCFLWRRQKLRARARVKGHCSHRIKSTLSLSPCLFCHWPFLLPCHSATTIFLGPPPPPGPNHHLEMTTMPNMQPYFDFDVQRNVTVAVGQTAFLQCHVERLGDKDVSIYML